MSDNEVILGLGAEDDASPIVRTANERIRAEIEATQRAAEAALTREKELRSELQQVEKAGADIARAAGEQAVAAEDAQAAALERVASARRDAAAGQISQPSSTGDVGAAAAGAGDVAALRAVQAAEVAVGEAAQATTREVVSGASAQADALGLVADAESAITDSALAAGDAAITSADDGSKALGEQVVAVEAVSAGYSSMGAAAAEAGVVATESSGQVSEALAEQATGIGVVSAAEVALGEAAAAAGEEQVAALADSAASARQLTEALAGVAAGEERAGAAAAASSSSQVEARIAAREAIINEREAQRLAAEEAARTATEEKRVADALKEIEHAATRAGEKMATFGAAAESGAARMQRPAVQARVAVNDLEAAIAKARANGDPIPPSAVASLRALTAEYDRNIERAGVVASATLKVQEELRAAQRASGELQGGFHSLRDVLGIVSPEAGRFAANIQGIGLGGLIAVQSLKILVEGVKKVGEASETVINHMVDRQQQEFEFSSGRFAENVRNMQHILVHFGEDSADVMTLSADRLRQQMVLLEEGQKKIEVEAEKVAKKLGGTATEVQDSTATIQKAIGDLSEQVSKKAHVAARDLIELLGKSASQASGEARESLISLEKEIAFAINHNQDLAPAIRHVRDAVKEQTAAFEAAGTKAPGYLQEITKSAGDLGRSISVLPNQAKELAVEFEKIAARARAIGDAEGADKAEELAKKYRLLAHSLADTRAEQDALLVSMGSKTEAAFVDSAKKLEAYIELVRSAGPVSAEQGEIMLHAIESLRSELEKLPADQRAGVEGFMKNLESLRKELDQTSAVALKEFGVKTPDAIRRSADALSGYIQAVGGLGSVTGVQADTVRKHIEEIRSSINALPPDQRAAVADLVAQLDQYNAALSKSSQAVLHAFGVQTPDAIQRSIDSLKGFVAALGPLGTVTKEQAEHVKSEALKIEQAIAQLPKAQRDAMADQRASLHQLEAAYGEYGQRVKATVVDVAAAIKSLEGVFKPLEGLLDGLIAKEDQLKQSAKSTTAAQASGGVAGAHAQSADQLRASIKSLQDSSFLSPDQANQLEDMKGQLAKIDQSTQDLSNHQLGWRDTQQKVVVAGKDVQSVLKNIVDGLHNNKDAWGQLSDTQQDAITRTLQGLQDAANGGQATQQVLEDSLGTVTNVLQSAGGQARDFADSLARSQGAAFDVTKALNDLKGGATDSLQALGDLRKETEQAGQGQAASSEDVKKAADAQSVAINQVKEKQQEMNKGWQTTVDLLTRCIELCQQLAQCASSVSLAAAG